MKVFNLIINNVRYSHIELPDKPAVHRVSTIQPQSPGVWIIPTLSQNTNILVMILEDTEVPDEGMVEGEGNTSMFALVNNLENFHKCRTMMAIFF